jgi:hypothetical protein
MTNYVYLGEYFDVLGRVTLTDKKIGFSKVPIKRERGLSETQSPIKYRVLELFCVDDMKKVEKMLHSILDSRRLPTGCGEWFRDEEDTLTGEFVNFMKAYGGVSSDIWATDDRTPYVPTPDSRLVNLVNSYGQDVELIRTYLGVTYDVLLRRDGMLVFNGEEFDTPNKLYNNGVVKYVKGVKGGSGTNNLSQFKIKSTGERLVD